jgi:hypothetical protein
MDHDGFAADLCILYAVTGPLRFLKRISEASWCLPDDLRTVGKIWQPLAQSAASPKRGCA